VLSAAALIISPASIGATRARGDAPYVYPRKSKLSNRAFFTEVKCREATIPLTLFDKPGRLNEEDSRLIETHLVDGFGRLWMALS
jgi:hypothetical protein